MSPVADALALADARLGAIRDKLDARGLRAVVEDLCRERRVLLTELFSDDTHKRVREVRLVLYGKLREQGWSFAEIGEFMGRASSTVQDSFKRFKRREQWVGGGGGGDG